MSSFFTVPGAQKKRKREHDGPANKRPGRPGRPAQSRPAKPQAAAKKQHVERDEEISGSDSELDSAAEPEEPVSESEESDREETAAQKRLRLATQYLSQVRDEVEATGWDAEQIDKDMIAARLEEDVAESKGKVFRKIASEIDLDTRPTLFRDNTHTVTSVAMCAPFVYLVTKDSQLIKYRLQPPPDEQYKQTTRKKPQKQAPPRKRPERIAVVKGKHKRAKDKNFKGHVGQILCVAVSDDGKFVVTGGDDKRIVVWDSALKPLRVFTHHRDAVTGLVFRRNSHQMYSCSKDRTIRVWNCDALAFVESLFGHADAAVDVDALALERLVSVGARDRTVRLWKVADETQLVFRASSGSGDKKKNANMGLDPNSCATTGSLDRVAYIDESYFVTGADNGSISLWTLTKKKPLDTVVRAHGLEDPLPPTVASSEEHPTAKDVPPPQPRAITSLRALPYSDLLLSGSTDGYIDKKLESVGILGKPKSKDSELSTSKKEEQDEMDIGDDDDDDEEEEQDKTAEEEPYKIKGVINDIAIIPRGKGNKKNGADDKELFSVVCAVGKEHRLGRWVSGVKGAKNGGVVFELQLLKKKAMKKE
ncbi:WD40 repeat-like protein [Poronia punctata]|nr:WD40 repeat-like protein [Poronia punctata]